MNEGKSILKTTVPVLVTFFVMGFVDIVGTTVAYVKHDFNLSQSVAQLLPMMVFIWFALLSVPVGIMQDRKGKRKTLTLGIVVTFVAMLLPLLAYSYGVILFSFLLIGIGNTIIQVSANPLLHDVSSKKNFSSNMSLSQLVKAVSSMLGPIITAELAKLTGDWKNIFLAYAITSVITAIWLYSVDIEETRSENKAATFRSSLGLLKDRFILLMVIGIFAIVGADVGMNTGIPNYLGSRFNLDVATATQGISIYFAALIVGRFLGTVLLRFMRSQKFYLLIVIMNLAGLFGMIFAPGPMFARVMIFIAGVGSANIFPVIFSFAVEYWPERSNEISGLMIMAVAGGAVMPFLMGVTSDLWGATASLFILVACIAYFLFISKVVLNIKYED
jgi:fucose permease